jgi:hypothetical protein
MDKRLIILLLVSTMLSVSGCTVPAVTSLIKDGPGGEISLPETGKFFTLDRLDKEGTFNEYVEVTYDGQIKVNSEKIGEKIAQVSQQEVKDMYQLIAEKRYDELKEKLKLDNRGSQTLEETLTLFNEDGRKQIFDITPQDLQTGENTILPDSWDVALTKLRRFLGALTGEMD